MAFTRDSIYINPEEVSEQLINKLRKDVGQTIKKRGAVIGVSGGIDSSVVLALCAKAFGPERCFGIMMPEKDSSPDSEILAKELVNKFGVAYTVEDLSDAVKGFGCYERRDEAIKNVFPSFDKSIHKAKIILPQDVKEKGTLNIFRLKVINQDGSSEIIRLPLKEYLQIVAASNFKQRSRMSMLYYHAEARNYAVIGTGNKDEHDQGFFVKYGDGGADIKPIAHLFKTQVFQLADYLGVPEEIQKRTPTTDTYSAEQTQEEFFFRLPFDQLDRIWHGYESEVPVSEIASVMEMTEVEVQNVIDDIKRKYNTTEYLRMEPI